MLDEESGCPFSLFGFAFQSFFPQSLHFLFSLERKSIIYRCDDCVTILFMTVVVVMVMVMTMTAMVMAMAMAMTLTLTLTLTLTVAMTLTLTVAMTLTLTVAMMVMTMFMAMTVRLCIDRGRNGCSNCDFRSLNIGWLLKHSRLEYIPFFFRERNRRLSRFLHLLLFSSLGLYILKHKPQ